MPYAAGLQFAADAFLSAGLTAHLAIALLAVFIVLSALSASPGDKDDAAVMLPGSSLFATYPFFCRRFDFLNNGFWITGQSVFQFNLLNHTVIVTSGESARKTFFTTRGFDLTEGFKILSGAIPMVQGVTSGLQSRRICLIHRRLTSLQRDPSLRNLIPVMLADCQRRMESWGAYGTFDPFEKIYELIFQTTVRSLSCSEIADDDILVARLKKLYDTLDRETTPASVLVPWFPTLSMIRKLLATKEIYEIVVRAINAREQSGVAGNDTLQMLLDAGDDRLVVVGFIMGLLIAGARATGISASWLIIFLGAHADWRARATTEVQALLSSHAPSTDPSLDPISARLAAVPLSAWESETPVLDSVIRETLRLAQSHAALRRNLGREVHINGKVVPTGAYVVYPFSDVHLDPELYPEPWKFDPSRRESKAAFGYVGWGGGKTVCLGSRLAKLELKLTTAMMLLGFNYGVVDKSGQPSPSPRPNWNDLLRCRPEDPCFVSYKRTDMPL